MPSEVFRVSFIIYDMVKHSKLLMSTQSITPPAVASQPTSEDVQNSATAGEVSTTSTKVNRSVMGKPGSHDQTSMDDFSDDEYSTPPTTPMNEGRSMVSFSYNCMSSYDFTK